MFTFKTKKIKKEEKTFPRLMRSPYTGAVYLMRNRNSGVCLDPGTGSMFPAESNDHISGAELIDHNEEVILKNK